MTNEYLAHFVKSERKQKGWTQKQLSKKAKTGLQTVLRIESGKNTTREVKDKILYSLGYQIVEKIEPIKAN